MDKKNAVQFSCCANVFPLPPPGSKGWLGSIADFLAPPSTNLRVTGKVDVLNETSLSKAFVRFLEEESRPRGPAPSLPALKAAEEKVSL